jgi:hypothetical protein
MTHSVHLHVVLCRYRRSCGKLREAPGRKNRPAKSPLELCVWCTMDPSILNGTLLSAAQFACKGDYADHLSQPASCHACSLTRGCTRLVREDASFSNPPTPTGLSIQAALMWAIHGPPGARVQPVSVSLIVSLTVHALCAW